MKKPLRQMTPTSGAPSTTYESIYDVFSLQEVSPQNKVSSSAEHPKTVAVYIAPYAVNLLQNDDTHHPFAPDVHRNLDLITRFAFAIGLGVSVVLMIGGVLLGLALQIDPPGIVPALHVTPDRILAIGLMVLIATPLLQVINSIVLFVYEHDWCFVGVTIGVLLVVLVSILIGNGG